MPKFQTDAGRTSFLIRLPVHPSVRPMGQETAALRDRAIRAGVESGVESTLEGRILWVLEKGPLAKSDIARSLGKGRPSGHLHETIADLVASGVLAYTHPDKPHSRLQRYQLTAKGRERLPTRP